MPREQHFITESDGAELHRKSHGAQASLRLWLLAMSLLFGSGLIWLVYEKREIGENLALGLETTSVPAMWNDRQINAWRIGDYQGVYKPSAATPAAREWLWLGNSQMYTINQMKPGERVAPAIASEALGYPAFALTIPNANLQEGLATAQWALTKRKPAWLIVPACYDDLREDDLRSDFGVLLGPEWEARMQKWPVSARLLDEVRQDADSAERGGGATQGPTRARDHVWILGMSVQDAIEGRLNDALNRLWPVWRDRDQMYAALESWRYTARNRLLGITPQTKRGILAVPYERNMSALEELLAVARDGEIRALVYIVPLRRDVEPPYHMDKYAAWKKTVEELCAKNGAGYADFDNIVPGELWGTTHGTNIDFMHFQGPGHVILANAVVAEVKRRERTGSSREGAR